MDITKNIPVLVGRNKVNDIIETLKLENEETVISLREEHLSTVQKFKDHHEKDLKDVASKSYSKAMADVNREFRYELDELKEDLNKKQGDKSVFNGEDPFYESLYSSYYGVNNKYAFNKLSDNVKEAVKYSTAKGYLTVYNSPFERHQADELRKHAQTIAYIRSFEDPIVGAIPDALTRFVLGRGIKFKASDYRVQSILERFWKLNNMEMYMKRLMWLLAVESEYFPLYFVSERSGDVAIREIQPIEIDEIETCKEDKDTRLSYKRNMLPIDGYPEQMGFRYYADIDYFERLDNIPEHFNKELITSRNVGEEKWRNKTELVQFVKLMMNREVRSRVMLERVLRWAEFYKNWIIDRAIINHEKGRVVWIVTISGRKSELWERFKPAPAGGTIKYSTQDKKWEVVNAKINADQAKDDGLFLLYQVAAGAGIPIHVLTQRTSEQVYSSIRASDTPFSQLILDLQDTLVESVLRPMFRLVVRSMINASNPEIKIPKKIKIRKYIKEHLRDLYRFSYEKYKKGIFSHEKFINVIRDLVDCVKEEYTEHAFNSRVIDNNVTISMQVLEACNDMEELCIIDSKKIMEDKKGFFHILQAKKVNKDIVSKSYDMFQNGFLVSIDAVDVPIDITFPDMVREDLEESAKVLKIHRELGIVSKTTASAKAGYNPEQENYLIKTEEFGIEEDPMALSSEPKDNKKKKEDTKDE